MSPTILKLRFNREFALKHAKFGVMSQIKRDNIYTEQNCSKIIDWNIAEEATLYSKIEAEKFIFGDKIESRPIMFIEYEGLCFIYPLTKVTKEKLRGLGLDKESGIGIELTALGSMQYKGGSVMQNIVLNGVVYEKDGCSIIEFNAKSFNNLINLKEKIVDSINNSETSPFVAVMLEGRRCLTKMMEKGHILPEDCAALTEDTKIWLEGKCKQGIYAQNRMQIADHLRNILIRDKTRREGNIKEEIQNNINVGKIKNDLISHKARDIYENIKRML